MALLGDGDETSSYSRNFGGMPKLLRDYDIHSHSFENLDGFKQICKDFFGNLMEGDMVRKSQYLGFWHVRMNDIASIDEIRDCIPKMTILYDSVEEVLILKFMMDVTHETCAGMLQVNFVEAVRARVGHIYSMCPLKSARFKGPQKMKEADDSFKPRSRNLKTDWPSIVFEVGVSEGLSQLRLDARFWLEFFGEQTRIVILASVNMIAGTIVIERWQDSIVLPAQNVANPNPYTRRCIPTLIQGLILERGQFYTGAPLTIPATLVFDVLPLSRGPPWGPSDFEITSPMLNMMNEIFWDVLQ